MRITWVTRSFLDYRIPVYAELNRLCSNQLTLIYNAEVVPERCRRRMADILGERSIALTGEMRLTGQSSAPISTTKRMGIRLPWQPGLIKAVRESKPDICVSDGFFQWTYAALWMRFWYKIPHVMCYEPTKHTERNAQFYRTWYRRLASHWIDAVCCNGMLCKEYCTDVLHIPEEKLFIGQMAADSEQLAREYRSIPDNEAIAFRKERGLRNRVFLFVGRLVELKGLRPFLEAWNEAALNSASFLCVGGGPLQDELRSFCDAKGISAYFTGEIDYRNVTRFYRAADVFVIPTLQDNWSLVVPEAMACGLPIACSKYNGCWPELVKPENGWVFDPLDRENTIRTIRKINSQDIAELQDMGQCSRQIVDAFSPAKAASAIFKSCEFAINHGGK